MGKGPNAVGDTAAPIRDLGYNSYSDNAATNPSTTIPGPRNGPASPAANIVLSGDTQKMGAPESGTLMPGGSGEKWTR